MPASKPARQDLPRLAPTSIHKLQNQFKSGDRWVPRDRVQVELRSSLPLYSSGLQVGIDSSLFTTNHSPFHDF